MDRLKPLDEYADKGNMSSLHSNMDRLKLENHIADAGKMVCLHSNMDRLKHNNHQYKGNAFGIYIPIWID